MNEWKKLNINYKNPPDPRALAETVWNLHVDGFRRATVSIFASYMIRKKFSQEYADDYFRRIKAISMKQKRLRQKERSKKMATAKDQGQTSADGERLTVKGKKRRRGDVNKSGIASERSERDQLRVIQEIEARGWWKLPIDKLEIVTRGFELPDAGAGYCTWVIKQHLEDINRADDAKKLPKLRKNHQARVRWAKRVEAEGGILRKSKYTAQ